MGSIVKIIKTFSDNRTFVHHCTCQIIKLLTFTVTLVHNCTCLCRDQINDWDQFRLWGVIYHRYWALGVISLSILLLRTLL